MRCRICSFGVTPRTAAGRIIALLHARGRCLSRVSEIAYWLLAIESSLRALHIESSDALRLGDRKHLSLKRSAGRLTGTGWR